MKNLNVGSLKIPARAATKSSAILAKRGAGKTYTAAVFAEEYAKAGIPFVVFDPIDVWWGLRLAANGKDKGLPVVVFGLEHADIQITRDDGPKIARAIVKENISCVISTFGMPKVAQRHLIAEFSEELLRINDTPRHIFIEEAHEFVPQRVQSGAGKCFAAVEALVVMGRNRGLGVTLINQRAATINKDVLTQVDNLVAMRSVGPQDRKALQEWVEFHSAEGDFKSFINSLPSLPTGEAWFWSPEFMGIFERIKIRKRETFHPDREKLGENFKIPTISQTDIKGFIESFSTKKAVPVPAGKTPTASPASGAIAATNKAAERENAVLRVQVQRAIESAEKWLRYAGVLETQLTEFTKTASFVMRNERPTSKSVQISVRTVVAAASPRPVVSAVETPADGKLVGAERKVYSFLFANSDKTFTKVQIGAMTGYSPTSGGFNNALYRLNTLGLTRKDGQKIGVGVLDGSLANPGETFSTDTLVAKLGKAEREIYRFLADNPGQHSKDEIGAATGYSPTSGGFNNSIYHLNSIGLIIKGADDIELNPEIVNL